MNALLKACLSVYRRLARAYPQEFQMVYGEELALGAIYSVAVSPDGKLLAIGCGPRGRQLQEVNSYILKMPDAVK